MGHNIIKIQTLENHYSDPDHKLLHVCFQILVDFIEIEKANQQRFCNIYKKSGFLWKLYTYCPWWIKSLFIRRRSRKLGLDYLDWELTISDEFTENEDGTYSGCPGQAAAAKEQKELYLWWKDVYPTRKDAMELSGLSDFMDKLQEKYGSLLILFGVRKKDIEKEDLAEYQRLHDVCREYEKKMEEEEDEMLNRLIKIRRSLWC